MNRRTVWVLLVLPLVLAGCTAEGKKPTVLPSPAPAAPSAASPSAAPAPSVPVEATAATATGASAFVRHYFEIVVNEAYASGEPEPVAALSDETCMSCRNIVSDVQRLTDARRTVAGKRFVVQFAEAPPPEADGSTYVDFRFSADRYLEVDAAGTVFLDVPARVGEDGQAKLVRKDGSWVVAGIRLVQP